MSLPYIHQNTLYVDGKPYLILGGELHNSTASSPDEPSDACMQALRAMGLNTLLVPVYWEQIEPAEGNFCFDRLDALVSRARRSGLRLGLLWFGLWKNAQSTYAPAWVKQDSRRFFRAVVEHQLDYPASTCLISPCCEQAVQADARAFAALMAHLRQTDAVRTVILVQVENEVGVLGAGMDRCQASLRLYAQGVPATLSPEQTGAPWQQVYGDEACAAFSAYCFATALQNIADAGAREYSLPLYANAWTVQYPGECPGSYPSGGPVAEHWDIWRACAPALQFFSPDIYLPDFQAECDKYAQDGNTLFIPEMHKTNHAAAYALYAVGRGAIGVSPFGIEELAGMPADPLIGMLVQEALGVDVGQDNSHAMEYLAGAYRLLADLWPLIVPLRGTPALAACLQGTHKRQTVHFERYDARVTFLPARPNAPKGAALLAQTALDEFLLAGTGCMIDFTIKPHAFGTAEILSIEEGRCEGGCFVPTRVRNGDEQRPLFTAVPRLLRVRLHTLPPQGKENEA